MLFPMPDDFDLSVVWRRAPVDSPDERLARMVRQRLYDDPWTCLRRVRVQVQNGVVILEGELESARARWVAAFHAWQTPGVRDVCNMLTEPDDHGGDHGAEPR